MPQRFFIFLTCFLLLCSSSKATHIVGGELGYTLIEKRFVDNDSFYFYQVFLRMNKDVFATGTLPPAVVLNVHTLGNIFVTQTILKKISQRPMPISNTLPCTSVPTGAAYEVAVYADTLLLPFSTEGYILSASSCCRLTGLINVANSINIGASYTANIPPHSLVEFNSTPQTDDSIKVICKNIPATFSIPFFDPDGDELQYEFCSAYGLGNDPPFTPLAYDAGYSGINPLGGTPPVTINPATSEINGFIENAGDYVVSFCIKEIRNGQVINVYRKEFQYRVQVCATPSSLPEKYFACRSFDVTFTNSNNPTYGYRWDFGVLSQQQDTSLLQTPTFTYPDTGIYRAQLIITRSPLCSDTSYTNVIVYPTLLANYTIPAIRCSGNPLLFNDATTATYGQGTKWKWRLQYPSTTPFKLIDSTQNLLYSFPTIATADTVAKLRLYVESSYGCIDSITKPISILQSPMIDAGPNLNFCRGDNNTINASSSSNVVQWQPNVFLSNPGIVNPMASPPNTTVYYLLATNGLCSAKDSLTIFVTPKPQPNAGVDTVLCFNDSTVLNGSGGQFFSWSPAIGLNNVNLRNPTARPLVSTIYILSVKDTLGCNRIFKDSVFVRVVSKLKVNAGRDTFVVIPNSVQLKAIGAPLYNWMPANFLNDASIATPTITVANTQVFLVKGYTPEGCFAWDSVKVRVLEHEPDIFVPTAFSPNKDGLNDVLKPVGYGVEFLEIFAVYNRLGQQLFVTTSLGKGWDGTLNGKPQPTGAYVWQLKAIDFKNKVIEKTGSTVLIR